MTHIRWRPIRTLTATTANRRESALLTQKLQAKGVKVWYDSQSRTTKGTRCVRVFVDATHYDYAIKTVKELLPFAFTPMEGS